MVFTIEIEKSKIIEVWDSNHNKVLEYKQILKNKDLDDSINIVAENLTELMTKVRYQVKEWKKSEELI